MQSRDIDEELAILIAESQQHTWEDYCRTCHAPQCNYCEDCIFEEGMEEPSEYLSLRDMMLFCEYESHNYGDQ